MLFEGFKLEEVDTGEARLRVRSGGKGPPLLLVHGCPQTHVMWHEIAPGLAKDYTVIAPDLRGYGASTKPPASKDHLAYSKRAMNRDLVALMKHFGHDSFHIVGHDRGARCGYRMALDSPERVKKLAVLDIIPTTEVYRHLNKEFAHQYFPWLFFPAPAPLPEMWLEADKDCLFLGSLRGFSAEAYADYEKYYRNPRNKQAICEDYRAGYFVDSIYDDEDKAAGRKIKSPVLALWGSNAPLAQFDMLKIWREWADNVTGHAITGGHFFPNDNPKDTTDALRKFLTS